MKIQTKNNWIGLLLFLFLGSSCQSSEERAIIAKVEGETISADDFRSRIHEYQINLQTQTPPSLEFKQQVLNELIEEKAVLKEAKKRNLFVPDEELDQAVHEIERDYPGEAFRTMLEERQMSYSQWRERRQTSLLLEKVANEIIKDTPPPSPKNIQQYYQTHLREFKQELQVHIQQILVKTRLDGEKILAELKKGASFDDLARTYSVAPEAAQNGNLGFITKGMMPEVLEKAFWNLPIQRVSPLVQSEYGFHLVRVLDRRPERQQSLEEVKGSIEKILTQKDREEFFFTWRRKLLSQLKIERNDGLLANIH